MTKVIGLIGGIGSGKSTVSQFLMELGAIIIDADKVGHEAFLPDTPAWHDVTAAFGQDIIAPSGEIDRKKLDNAPPDVRYDASPDRGIPETGSGRRCR